MIKIKNPVKNNIHTQTHKHAYNNNTLRLNDKNKGLHEHTL